MGNVRLRVVICVPQHSCIICFVSGKLHAFCKLYRFSKKPPNAAGWRLPLSYSFRIFWNLIVCHRLLPLAVSLQYTNSTWFLVVPGFTGQLSATSSPQWIQKLNQGTRRSCNQRSRPYLARSNASRSTRTPSCIMKSSKRDHQSVSNVGEPDTKLKSMTATIVPLHQAHMNM